METSEQTDLKLRRQSWHGAKKYIKLTASVPVINPLIYAIVKRCMPQRNPSRLPVPLNVTSVTARVLDYQFAMFNPRRCVVAKELYWGRGVRSRRADQIALESFARLVPNATHVLDIGAYTGIFTLLAATVSPSCTVDAYEIVPANYIATLENLLENKICGSGVAVHLQGVGRGGSRVTVPYGQSGSALPDFYNINMNFDDGLAVETVSLNSIRLPEGSNVIIKIDVEGSEAEIFVGGEEFINIHRPSILCELLHGIADTELIEASLNNLGYHYFLVTDGGLVEYSRLTADIDYRDWLITPHPADKLRELGVALTTRS